MVVVIQKSSLVESATLKEQFLTVLGWLSLTSYAKKVLELGYLIARAFLSYITVLGECQLPPLLWDLFLSFHTLPSIL
jgi:hypothetical protein